MAVLKWQSKALCRRSRLKQSSKHTSIMNRRFLCVCVVVWEKVHRTDALSSHGAHQKTNDADDFLCRVPGGDSSVAGVGQPESRQGRACESWQSISIIHRYTVHVWWFGTQVHCAHLVVLCTGTLSTSTGFVHRYAVHIWWLCTQVDCAHLVVLYAGMLSMTSGSVHKYTMHIW